MTRPSTGAVLAALATACACAGPAHPPSPPPTTIRAGPAAFASGDYGPEPAVRLTPIERAVAADALPHLGSPAPRLSPALVLAAREVASRASRGGDPRSPGSLRAALADGLAFDPSPSMHFAAAPVSSVPAALASTLARAPGATHFGVGAIAKGGQAYAVLLLARRVAALRRFPRHVAQGNTVSLEGDLVGLEGPSVHVTGPAGESHPVPTMSRRSAFRADLHFDAPGPWLVEVVGDGPGGPEVAALMTVHCGRAPVHLEKSAPDEAEPADLRQAEAAVVTAINATRLRHGLAALTPTPQLAEVARRHSEAMLAAGKLAHVLPGSGSVADRLRRAGIGYRAVYENVARGASALRAHSVIEESPAHRENVLAPDAIQVGCGAARGRLPGGEPAVYLTEIFLRPVDDGSGDHRTPDTLVKVALWAERSRMHAPALTSDPRLDELARGAAARMLRRGEPGAAGLAERALDLGRRVAAADAFVASSPGDAMRSRNLRDPHFRRVGVGVAIGDNPRYGKGLLWIAVIYTD